jgi:hypothetical protein
MVKYSINVERIITKLPDLQFGINVTIYSTPYELMFFTIKDK